MRTVPVIIFIIILTGTAVFLYFYSRNQHQIEAERIVIDTVYIPYTVHDTLKIKVYRIRGDKQAGADAVDKQNGTAGHLIYKDSISPAAAETYFIARADTVYQDSLLSLRMGFISPLPIHPDSRFIVDVSYRKMLINRQVQSPQAFTRSGKLHFSLNLGLGLGLIHGRADIFAGAGVSYSF